MGRFQILKGKSFPPPQTLFCDALFYYLVLILIFPFHPQSYSILSLLGLFVHTGNTVKIVLSGPDENKALEILDRVFNERDNAVIYP
jgi:hypothetical protein